MKRLIISAAATALFVVSMAQERMCDPSAFDIEGEPMRTSFIVSPKAEQAVAENDFRLSPQYRSLEGEWRFLRVERPDAVPTDFAAIAFDDSAWGTMPVPGIWELNGYGDPVYTNQPYPWYKFFENNPPYVPFEQNYTGLYRRIITVPEQWQGKEIKALYKKWRADTKKKGYGSYGERNVDEFWAETTTKAVHGTSDKYTRAVKSIVKKYKL